jgi:hypothetical protein
VSSEENTRGINLHVGLSMLEETTTRQTSIKIFIVARINIQMSFLQQLKTLPNVPSVAPSLVVAFFVCAVGLKPP